MQFLIIIALLVGLMWLFVIRPQRRRQADQQSMLETLDVGEEVITAGGLYGVVRAVDDDTLELEIAPGTQVKVARRAIAAVLRDEEDDELEDEEDDLEGAEDELEDAEADREADEGLAEHDPSGSPAEASRTLS